MSWKRQLFLWHRWMGISLCLFFALWFVSGIFMMYVPFPELTRPERLAGAQPLASAAVRLTPGEAVARLEPRDFATRATPSTIEALAIEEASAGIGVPRSIRLVMILGRPAYVVHVGGAQPRVVFADDGTVLREVTPPMGQAAAAAFSARRGHDISAIEYEGAVHTDQWTVSGGLNAHRPLLRYALHDEDGTNLYVSSRTGEVVRDTHSTERVLNYFGAVTHWLYPTFIRKYPLAWEWLVDIVSFGGVVIAVTGLWIGLLRWKRRPQPGKSHVPYRGLMRWHYLTGITFGLVTVTWVFSGLMSMNPLSLNPSSQPSEAQALVFAGRSLQASDFEVPAQGFGADAIEAVLFHYAGQAFYRVTDRDGTLRIVAGNAAAVEFPQGQAMLERASELLPSARIVEARTLTDYDDYYYARRPERGGRPLPALRVRFDDEQRTWFHLDPRTGEILERSTRTNRAYRWLYNGLHSFDLWWLWQRRPLWDIVVIAFSLGGAVLSSIGVVIGWRRLRYKQRRRAPQEGSARPRGAAPAPIPTRSHQ